MSNMNNYRDLLAKILAEGSLHTDRTGVGTVRIFGASLEYDLSQGFPVISFRKMPWKGAIGEMIGFVRGANTVEEFELLKCKFWGANAKGWKSSQADGNVLGRIYGVQSRWWNTQNGGTYDQLKNVLDELRSNPDSRRLLVTHWRPDEFKDMALPPCHVQYQFLVDKDRREMSLKFDMRSTDMVLGAPNNIMGYAFLLMAVSYAFKYTPKKLIMTMADCHIYKDHIEGVQEMLKREDLGMPMLAFNAEPPPVVEGEELQWIEMLHPDMFDLIMYEHHPHIPFKMAV